jgi:hypothetical protein
MKQTVNSYLVKRLGVRRALAVEAFVIMWAMFSATHDGRDPVNIQEFAEEIGKDQATVYRWREWYREAFPDWVTPRELLDHMNVPRTKVMTPRQLGKRSLGGV